MIYIFIAAIIGLTVWYVLTDSITRLKYSHYWVRIGEDGNGKLFKKPGKITLYNNISVWHGQLDYKVKKIIRKGGEIELVVTEDKGIIREFFISK